MTRQPQFSTGHGNVRYCYQPLTGHTVVGAFLPVAVLSGARNSYTFCMRWKGRRQSGNVEDRRGVSAGTVVGGGVGTIILAVVIMLLGGNPADVLNSGVGQGQQVGNYTPTPEEEERKEFVGVVLADTEDVWKAQFAQLGKTYAEPTLVVFSGRVESACGLASAASGPFYCPADDNVYIDLSFFKELQSRFGATGEFAQAYVVAHEVGHHVQNLLGTSDQVQAARGRMSESEYNQLSVRLELQADFYAGVWAHHTQKMKNVISEKDIAEAIEAASAIGDDRIQMESQGYVVPDGFTHGTSEQRARWFLKGWKSGNVREGDTFKVAYGDL